nr:hypothetical protein [Amycolatopsis thermoflava]
MSAAFEVLAWNNLAAAQAAPMLTKPSGTRPSERSPSTATRSRSQTATSTSCSTARHVDPVTSTQANRSDDTGHDGCLIFRFHAVSIGGRRADRTASSRLAGRNVRVIGSADMAVQSLDVLRLGQGRTPDKSVSSIRLSLGHARETSGRRRR